MEAYEILKRSELTTSGTMLRISSDRIESCKGVDLDEMFEKGWFGGIEFEDKAERAGMRHREANEEGSGLARSEKLLNKSVVFKTAKPSIDKIGRVEEVEKRLSQCANVGNESDIREDLGVIVDADLRGFVDVDRSRVSDTIFDPIEARAFNLKFAFQSMKEDSPVD